MIQNTGRPNGDVGAIILAGGSSQRMGGLDKVTSSLGGKSILARVVDTFQGSSSIDRIVIVMSPLNLKWGRRLAAQCRWSKVIDICNGGKRRQDSVALGLNKLAGCSWVVIHDGARPLVTEAIISRGIAAAVETGAAIAAVPVWDTIKLADNNLVYETLPRNKLWAIQTPQVFREEIIRRAYRNASDEVTDDSSLVELIGCPVKIYSGSYDNIKLTTPQDLILAEILLDK